MSILRRLFETNFGYKLIWIVVISSIIFSLFGTRYELAGGNLADHPFYSIFLSTLDNVRYGHLVARRLFLVVIAFLVFGYWLKTQKKILLAIRNNLKYIVLIGLALVVSRILTFGFWFYNDDTRFFHYHLSAPTQPDYNPQATWVGKIDFQPFAILLLVMRWFGTNYSQYNILSLFFYFLAGVATFVLANKLQNNKFISLVAAVFLLTTPTYFQNRLLIVEILNSPFALLLVIVSLYMVLQKFIPGALIFAAAALGFGAAKTYFIILPLTLFALFFSGINSIRNIFSILRKEVFLLIAALGFVSFVYLPAFSSAPGGHGPASKMFELDQLLVYGDVLLAVTIPHGLSYPLVHLLSLIFNDWIYITIVLGFLVIASFISISIIAYLRGRTFSAKLIIAGLSIILPTALISSYMGVRIDHNVQKLVEYHNNSQIPSGATGYGIFPALGLTLILIGLGHLLKKKAFTILAVSLIFINIVSSVSSDYKWAHSIYGLPQRKFDEQLQRILPRDGINKYVYVPSKQRPFYQGVVTFGSIFQGDQQLYTFMSPDEFVQKLKEDKAQKDHIYFLLNSGKPNYDVYDYSNKIRSTPYNQLIPLVQSLTKELTEKNIDF